MSETVHPANLNEPISVDDNATTLSVDDGGSSLTVDNAGLTELAAAIDTEVQVDVVGALPAGNNNIGDVDVASSALPTGASTAANQSTIIGHLDGVEASLTTIDGNTDSGAVVGSGTEATAQRVTIATDSTGVLSVDDNGGTLTVDNAQLSVVGSGTEAAAMRVTIATDSTGVLSVDDNGSTISVDDGASSLTVDNATISVVGGGTEATAQRVTIASDSTGVLSVDDNGGTLTVDGTVTAAGGAAHASPVSGNPNLVAGRASNAIPTDVGADGDVASMWTNRNGATVITMAPHVGLNGDPWSLVHEGVQYTTAQTSAVVVAGGASEKIVVTQVQLQAFSTTAGTAILYFGTGAFARGTNRAIFDGDFTPSATLKPGVVLQGPFISGANGDDLLFTSVGDLDITISVWYYVVT